MVSEPNTISTNSDSTMAATMATAISTSSSSTMSSSTSSINLANQPLLLLSNMSNMMTVKLDNSNYIIWKHQISMVMETYSMIELLDETPFVPKKFLKDLSGSVTTVLNLDFLVWKSKEKALLTFINSTLTPSVLAITVGCSLALEVWKVLENRFSSFLRSHVMNLKGELHSVKKGSDSVDTYLQKIKVISDKLMAVGIFLEDEELLHMAIKGLPKEFSAFRSAIRIRSTKLSFDELATMLNAEEESMNEGLEIKDSTFAMSVNTAPRPNNSGAYNNYNQSTNHGRGRNNNYRGRGRGFSPNYFSQHSPNQGFGPRIEMPPCQICGKAGHIAIDCYHRMDYAYQGKHPPTKLAAMVTSSNSMIAHEQPWLADSAATDHVTSNLNHLSFPKPYNGQDHLTVGNGQSLPITHKLPFPSSRFVATAPFELVHTDLWGPTPLTSINGFQYYVIFVDHYTRFTWLYLLQNKSEVYSKFVQFHAMIQT